MPAYRYRAVHAAGHIRRGTATAANERELIHYLSGAGLELIDAREKAPPRVRAVATGPRLLATFCTQIADMLKAGVPFVDALRDIGMASDSGLCDVSADIVRLLMHGSSISRAFARYPRLFLPVFVAILAAGEASGDLAVTFARLAHYAESRARLQERLRRAVRYPLFLMALTLGVVVFMMVLVVPQIVLFLHSIEGQLPFSTRLLIAVSSAFARSWWIVVLALAVLAVVAALLRHISPGAARTIDAGILRLPVMGTVLNKLMLARFAHSFALLFQSGLGVTASLRHARDTLGNRALEAALDQAIAAIEAGRPLSQALDHIFPPFARRILRVGEQSGQLGKSLGDIAAAYDREAGDVATQFIGALEPALTIMVGGLMAWIVLAVLGPIYGNLGKLVGS